MAKFAHNFVEKVPGLVSPAVTYSKPQVELVPPTPADLPAAIQSAKKIIQSAKTGSFKQLKVKEAVLNGLVATEVWMWFYGRRDHRQTWHRWLRCVKTDLHI
ncbi:ATP synthase subunit g, mitochondrial [Lemmus lemmus]